MWGLGFRAGTFCRCEEDRKQSVARRAAGGQDLGFGVLLKVLGLRVSCFWVCGVLSLGLRVSH